ncbi:MAG TPA: hypothetical protein VHU22_20675, partial [Xanthobacteraceae bacterium]|nr:hypothetical protein [Xanthobacteraceae bacterium]
MRLPEGIPISRRLVARPLVVSMVLATALGSGVVAAHAGPCADQIAQLQKVAQSKTPILPQKLGAQ